MNFHQNQFLKKMLLQVIIAIIVFFIANYLGEIFYRSGNTPLLGIAGFLSLACRIYIVILVHKILIQSNRWVQLILLVSVYSLSKYLILLDKSSNAPSDILYPLLVSYLCYIYFTIWLVRIFKKPEPISSPLPANAITTDKLGVTLATSIGETLGTLSIILGIIVTLFVIFVFVFFSLI